MKTHTRYWTHADSPLVWLESIYVGDTKVMKEHFGFVFGGHYFTSVNQKITYYQNIESEKLAKKIGAIKFKNLEFIKYFYEETKKIEEKLNKITNEINSIDLNKKELFRLFKEFFNQYSKLLGFYRFCRPEFYEVIIEEIKEKLPEPKQKNLFLVLENKFDNLNLDENTKKIAEGLNQIGDRRFEMHKAWMRIFADAKKLFEKIGKIIDFETIEVENCTSNEIKKALSENKIPDKQEIRKRLEKFKFVYYEDRFEIEIPEKIEQEKFDITEFKGTPACHGKAKGKVTLLTESLSGELKETMEKMPEGNILVAVMTSPDMVPAMKKASAIITDEGGMLCHAAIVSREFKIPCVIGTRNATKILKDGDLVEVDAEKGVVRKIIS